ncbi:MAG: YggS family pyridoxal phosphate-dependent enzyme [Candidatus Omnitrophica bacterium]|nr:YggS family pyridoxal phosphate-dependent enzyme [Candidatus Omnitrophota bacterium]
MIASNIESVTRRISNACEKSGRQSAEVQLICVTKTASIEEIEEVLGLGAKALGENRVQDAVSKHRIIGDRAQWHLIGHLQTNKAKDAVKIFSLIHSVDSSRLAAEISAQALKIGKVQDILIQVNVSGEASKFGIEPTAVEGLIKEISLYPNINIKGFMTIAPDTDDPERSRPYFKALRELRDRIIISGPCLGAGSSLRKPGLEILSMGMSGDFEVAIEEGSNMVRVGRAIFEGHK